MDTEAKTYSELKALSDLLDCEKRNTILINGNFSFFAKKWKIKVSRLRELYKEAKNNDK